MTQSSISKGRADWILESGISCAYQIFTFRTVTEKHIKWQNKLINLIRF